MHVYVSLNLNVKEFNPKKLYIVISDFQFLITYFHQRRVNCRIDQFVVGNSGLSYMVVLEHLKKKCALVDYVGENFFVNLFPLKCNDTDNRNLDVCMDPKLIKYGIPGSRGPAPRCWDPNIKFVNNLKYPLCS